MRPAAAAIAAATLPSGISRPTVASSPPVAAWSARSCGPTNRRDRLLFPNVWIDNARRHLGLGRAHLGRPPIVAVSHLAADAGPIVHGDTMVHDDRDVIETGGHLRVRLPLALDYPVTPSPGRLAVGRDTLSGSAGRAGQGVIGHGSPDGEAIALRNAGFHGPEW